jgi:hypothetical protein
MRRRIYQTDWNRNDAFLTVLVDADAKLTTHADLALTSGSSHRAEVPRRKNSKTPASSNLTDG